MAKVTLESCKAPLHTDFPKLAKIGAHALFDEARRLKSEIAQREAELKKLAPRIQAKLETALDEDTNSVLYIDLLVSKRRGYTKRTFDNKWAVHKLLAKGVKKAEIDEHYTETEVQGGISMQLLGSEEDE